MDLDTAVDSEEGLQQQTDDSSSDLRGALNAAIKEVSERARDDQGRFAKNDKQPQQADKTEQPRAAGQAAQAAAAATDPAAKHAAQQQPDQQPDQQAQQQQQAIKAPDAWSPASKAKFAELPPDIQAEIARRESEVHKGFTAQDEHRKLGKTFEQAVMPYLPMIRAEGSDPIQAVQEMLQTAYSLRTATPAQKQEMFIGLAQQFGVDMNSVFQRLAGGQPQANPQVAALEQQVQQLQQRLTQGDQRAQADEQAQIGQQIESFASDQKNVFYADVRADMAALLRAGRAQTLQEAYDMACWARPDIRPHLLQQQDQQRATEMKAKADKARAAGVSIAGSPTGSAGAVAPQDRSLRDELRANFRAAMAG